MQTLDQRFTKTVKDVVKDYTDETHRTIADVLGVSRSRFSNRLRDGGPWRLADLEALAAHWSVPAHELLLGTNAMKKAGHLPSAKPAGQTRI